MFIKPIMNDNKEYLVSKNINCLLSVNVDFGIYICKTMIEQSKVC